MGRTVVSATVASTLIGNDDDVDVKAPFAVAGTVALNSLGTSPAAALSGGGSKFRIKLTSGSGSPAIAANNVVITLSGTTRTPRKVYVGADVLAPGWHVASVGAGTVSIGTKVAPAASTVYDLDVIVLF